MRQCSRSISPERMTKIQDNIRQVELLSEACFTTLKCDMCGEAFRDWVDAPHVAEMAFTKGWRWQKWGLDKRDGEGVLCPNCTDDKR